MATCLDACRSTRHFGSAHTFHAGLHRMPGVARPVNDLEKVAGKRYYYTILDAQSVGD